MQEHKQSEEGVTETILEQYWRPDNLTIKLNGEILKDKEGKDITANYRKDGYQIVLIKEILEKIPGVTLAEENIFFYREKEYQYGTDAISVWEMVQIFKALIRYNYEEGILQIDIV